MADFNPDEYLAAKTAAPAFDPDAYLAAKAKPAAPAEPPDAGESFLRSASNAVSSNFANPIAAGVTHLISGQPYQDALKGINESDAAAKAAHPTASTLGTVAGTGLQMAAPLPAMAGASPVLKSAAIGAGFSAAQGAGNALNAGGDALDAVKGAVTSGVAGGVTGVVLGGVVGKLASAPERVDERIVANIARGEAGGAAKASVADKMIAKKDVVPQLEATGLKGAMATGAAANPGKVADKVTGVIDKYTSERLDPMYAAIDAGPAVPKGAELKASLQQMSSTLRASGEWQQAAHVDKYAAFVDKSIPDAQPLTASIMRKARNEVGLGNTFASHEEGATPAAIRAKQAIYGAFNDTIEKAGAATPGVDVAALKSANKTVSTLLAVRNTLADRAVRSAKGASNTTGALLTGGARIGEAYEIGKALLSGDLSHLASAAGIYAGEKVVKALPQAGRVADYGLSRLELASRAGNPGAQALTSGIQVGARRALAPAIASRAGQFFLPPPNQDGPQ